MSYVAYQDRVAANASVQERVDFIRLTYLHLGGAIAAFAAVCALMVNSPIGAKLTGFALGGPWNWLLVLGGFMLIGRVAEKWAMSGGSAGKHYLGLALYIVAQAVITVPLLYVAENFSGDPNVIKMAGLLTLVMFGGLTGTVFLTKKDFSFMGRGLQLASFGALGFILVGTIFGFGFGTFFASAMVLLMAGYVLYSTSNVLRHYPIGSHVAASLALFATIATLFFYVLQLVMSASND